MRSSLLRLAVVTFVLLLASACATSVPPAAPSSTHALPASTPVPPTPAPTLKEEEKLLRAFLDAFNRRDLAAATALLAEEGLDYFDASQTYRSKAEVREALETFVGYGNAAEVVSCGPDNSGVSCVVDSRNDSCIKATTGLDVAPATYFVTSKGGKIQTVRIVLLPDVKNAFDMNVPKYAAWAEANRPDEWKKIIDPAANGLAGQALGELDSSVCKAYLERQQ